MLQNGAPIEPGRLTVEIEMNEYRQLSASRLLCIFGKAWVDDIKSRLPPKMVPHVIVSESLAVVTNEPQAAQDRSSNWSWEKIQA